MFNQIKYVKQLINKFTSFKKNSLRIGEWEYKPNSDILVVPCSFVLSQDRVLLNHYILPISSV
jgi:hypothetical protein